MDVGAAAALVLRAAICSFLAFGAAYWIITSWIDRRLSAVEAMTLLSAVVVVTIFLVAYVVQNSMAILIVLLLVVGSLVYAMTLYSRAADRRLHQHFDEEDIKKYLAALEFDPKNVAAHSLLADTYRRQGRLEEALAEYREAVRLSPDLQHERYWIDRLMIMIERKEQGQSLHYQEAVQETPCPACGALVPPEVDRCQECGAYVGKG